MSQEQRMTHGGRIRVSPGATWEQDPIEAAEPGANNGDAEPVDDDTASDLRRAVERGRSP